MRKLNIIMPMAGRGLRFSSQGIRTPKPLLTIDDQYFFIKALSSLNNLKIPMSFSFIILEEHTVNYGFSKILKEVLPDSSIFTIKQPTRGAVETCMFAVDHIDDNDAVLILDCDLYFESKHFSSLIEETCKDDKPLIDGGILVAFNSSSDKYSYAQASPSGRVTQTAEKKVISNNALIGAYFFSFAKEFKDVARFMLNQDAEVFIEYYVSLMYNFLISKNKYVALTTADEYMSFGTPEELKAIQK